MSIVGLDIAKSQNNISIDHYPFELGKREAKAHLSNLINNPLKIDGLSLLSQIPNETIKAAFFDPQYRGVLDKMNYGNEGKKKEKRRCSLSQMSEETIISFIQSIDQALVPSGHLFLWVDKFCLCESVSAWFENTKLSVVDLIVWEKPRIGLGYRTRNKCEFLLVIQKKPQRAKGVWTVHNIPNVIQEAVDTSMHPHVKPMKLQQRLIEAVSKEEDIILDPAMGSGSVLKACQNINRNFIGGDLTYNN